jgi:serine protease Do
MNPNLRRLLLTLTVCLPAPALLAQPLEKQAAAVKIDPAPLNRQGAAITSFAPIVEKVAPSVVQIATTRATARSNPTLDDLRRFFGLPDPSEPQPDTPRRRDRGTPREPFGLGSGVVVTPDGHILTNNHVIDGADDILVTFASDKKEYKATKVGVDPGTDLAVLKLESKPANLQTITFGDSDQLRVGDFAIAVGNPFGLTQTVTMGIVSSIGRNDMGIVAYENFIQTDASINPGNSGGPLVDVEGRLIGINTAIFSRTGTNAGIGFAVPANLARNILDSILKTGRVVRGFLGVGIQDLDENLARKLKIPSSSGAVVNEITPKSPAATAGLEPGDVITEINGKSISGPAELRMTISSMMPGSKVNLKYRRGSDEKTTQVELAELPASTTAAITSPEAAPGEPDVLDGVTVSDIIPELRQRFSIPDSIASGVVITEVSEDSPSFAAGLRPGDVILEIERRPVKTADDAVKLSEDLKKEKEVMLRISSRGQSRFVVVKEIE